MDVGATTSTSELDGMEAATSVSANASRTRLACCAVGGNISTYAKEGAGWRQLVSWRLPDMMPVKAVWAHPEHGAVLAVLADTGVVTLFTEGHADGKMIMQLMTTLSSQHVTALGFGPKELGLQLATCSRDGKVRVYQAPWSSPGTVWVPQTEFEGNASSSPCTALCWRSYSQALPPMLVLGTEEGAKVFYYNGRLMAWEMAAHLGGEAVTDVGWTTTANGHNEYLASAHGTEVSVWRLEGPSDNLQAEEVATLQHKYPVCQVEWNPMGTWLAVATQLGAVSLWRQNLGGEWRELSKLEPQDQDIDYVMVEAR